MPFGELEAVQFELPITNLELAASRLPSIKNCAMWHAIENWKVQLVAT